MSDHMLLRITREIKQIQQGSDLSLAVAYKDSDIRHVAALIVGPPDSPYEFGFFEFAIRFGADYPAKPPHVRAATTNGGQCRFNPNIYAGGKVCLSILGTWRGERGEEWSSVQGLESILISIQSLLSCNPYENEPGYENARSAEDRKNMAAYIAKIRHETLRVAVIQPLEESLGITADGTVVPPPQPEADSDEDEDDLLLLDDGRDLFESFADLRKRRFLWYYECYMKRIAESEDSVRLKQPFTMMPFEAPGNQMNGHFDYPELKRRLSLIKETILEETRRWATEGQLARESGTGLAVTLQHQFEQVAEEYKRKDNCMIDLTLADGDPFVWDLTYFGRPMTALDGGVFNIKIHLSPRFPAEQPRVFVETPLFHYRVSKDGVLCYFPKRPDEMRSHVEAIVAALEEESPPYDPRSTVNLEASQLFWGSPDQRKQYNRLLRRTVERSTELY